MKKKICLVFVGGGLGNQMFQYACARNKALCEGKELVLLGNMFKVDPDKRTYRLDCLNIPSTVHLAKGIEERWYWFLFRLKKKLLNIFKIDYEHNQVGYKNGLFFVSPTYTFYKFESTNNMIDFMYGLFQSEKYFSNNIDIIKSELRVKKSCGRNKGLLKTINCCNSVCLHIRLGDYVNNNCYREYLSVCNKQYYLDGIKYIKENVENPVFFVFSNSSKDLEIIRKNYDLPKDVVYVDAHNNDFEDLELMYHCKHFILSNSSYSWWAQELTFNTNPVVVAPDIWIRGYEHSIDIYKENWKVIKVQI